MQGKGSENWKGVTEAKSGMSLTEWVGVYQGNDNGVAFQAEKTEA